MYNKEENIEEDVKEGFCPVCLTIPMAFIGIGISSYGNNSRKSHKLKKKISIIGFVISLISVIIAFYFYNNCTQCR
jgi:hypothetical protein